MSAERERAEERDREIARRVLNEYVYLNPDLGKEVMFIPSLKEDMQGYYLINGMIAADNDPENADEHVAKAFELIHSFEKLHGSGE